MSTQEPGVMSSRTRSEVELEPDAGLAVPLDAPAIRERVEEREPATGLGVLVRHRHRVGEEATPVKTSLTRRRKTNRASG
jgi:hypothetical protein